MPRSVQTNPSLAPRIGASLAAAVAAMSLSSALDAGDALASTRTKPTIVFVHGAFADASGFDAVTSRLEQAA